MFWREEDIWDYIKSRGLKYASIYDKGASRTGCIFCMFGVHLEKEPNRFQRLKETHPKLYDYCINKLGIGQVLDYIDVPY
jgi:3'-phosphoadenosine 5'-phosphosulfate sulfotransferase (PAPS reductase)/FAD synthetase